MGLINLIKSGWALPSPLLLFSVHRAHVRLGFDEKRNLFMLKWIYSNSRR